MLKYMYEGMNQSVFTFDHLDAAENAGLCDRREGRRVTDALITQVTLNPSESQRRPDTAWAPGPGLRR